MANPCIIVFKGKEYSFEDFASQLHDGLLDNLIRDGIIDNSKFKGNATKKIGEPTGVQGERKGGDEGGETTETGGRNRLLGETPSGKEEKIKGKFSEGDSVIFSFAGTNLEGTVISSSKEKTEVRDASGTQYTIDNKKINPNTKENNDKLIKSEIDYAKQQFKEAMAKLKKTSDLSKLGAAADPQKQAEALYAVHKALVRLAKAYIAKGINDIKQFAKSIGITEKQAQQAWDEANGVKIYTQDEVKYSIPTLLTSAIKSGINIRNKFAEYKQKQADLKQKQADIKKTINDFIDSAELKNSILPKQSKALIKRAANVSTEAQLDKFLDYAQKVIDDANYASDMDDIRKMQKEARKRKHVFYEPMVKTFTSVNPELLPDSILLKYKMALDALNSRTPSYNDMAEIFYDVDQLANKPSKYDSIKTLEQAQEAYDKIAINKVDSVEAYRDLFKDINDLKRRLSQMLGNGDITEDQYDDIMEQVGKDKQAIEDKYASEIASIKTDMVLSINDLVKQIDKDQLSKEELELVQRLEKLNNNDLRSLSLEDIHNLQSLIENLNSGESLDVFRLSPILDNAEINSRELKELSEQINKAKDFKTAFDTVEEATRKLSETFSSFWEYTLGLGAKQYGAFQKYIVTPFERAISSYRNELQQGFNFYNEAKKKYGIKDQEQLVKIGMIATYLREYGLSQDPNKKDKKDDKGNQLGTRDWFKNIIENKSTSIPQSEIDVIKKIWDGLPKVNGQVDVKAVWDAYQQNQPTYLKQNELDFLKEITQWKNDNMTNKQRLSNELMGKKFEELFFHIKRIRRGKTDTQKKAVVEIGGKGAIPNVRIQAGSGLEVVNENLGDIEANFEKIFTETLEENLRNYHLAPVLQKVNTLLNKTYGKVNKEQGGYIETIKKNLADAINVEFEAPQRNAIEKLFRNIMKSRAAQILINPVRTIVELVSSLTSYPSRAGVLNAYTELLKNHEVTRMIMKDTKSQFANKFSIVNTFDVEKGELKGVDKTQRASEYFAALPERTLVEPIWSAIFKKNFKEQTGKEFDAEQYKNNPDYSKENSKAIQDAASIADATYGQIAGSTTGFGQRRNIKVIPDAVQKSLGIKAKVDAKSFWGSVASFMTNYPFRETETLLKSFNTFSENIKNKEYSSEDMSKAILPVVGVFAGALSYNFLQAVTYNVFKLLSGDDEEKEKAIKEIKALVNGEKTGQEVLATLVSSLSSRYSGVSRVFISTVGSIIYNMTDDAEQKEATKELIRNITFKNPLEIRKRKTGEVIKYGLGEGIAMKLVEVIPPFMAFADNVEKAVAATNGIEYIYKKIEKGEELTTPERDAFIMLYTLGAMSNSLSQFWGWGLPNVVMNELKKYSEKYTYPETEKKSPAPQGKRFSTKSKGKGSTKFQGKKVGK
jgi:hypothetical protein